MFVMIYNELDVEQSYDSYSETESLCIVEYRIFNVL